MTYPCFPSSVRQAVKIAGEGAWHFLKFSKKAWISINQLIFLEVIFFL